MADQLVGHCIASARLAPRNAPSCSESTYETIAQKSMVLSTMCPPFGQLDAFPETARADAMGKRIVAVNQ